MAKQTETLISVAIICLIVIALISAIATETIGKTEKSVATDEVVDISPAVIGENINTTYAFTVANYPSGWKVGDCPLTVFSMTNGSGTALTVTTDYVVTASTGTFTLKNTADVNASINSDNETLITYTYCGDDYLNSSWGRSVLNITPGMIVIALLVLVVGGAYILLERKKNEGY